MNILNYQCVLYHISSSIFSCHIISIKLRVFGQGSLLLILLNNVVMKETTYHCILFLNLNLREPNALVQALDSRSRRISVSSKPAYTVRPCLKNHKPKRNPTQLDLRIKHYLNLVMQQNWYIYTKRGGPSMLF